LPILNAIKARKYEAKFVCLEEAQDKALISYQRMRLSKSGTRNTIKEEAFKYLSKVQV
jgi:hypothetical protein